MAITIQKLGTEFGSKTQAVVCHESHEFPALIDGSRASLKSLIGEEIVAEMDYDRITSWAELSPFDDEASVITSVQDTPNAIIIRGRVNNVLVLDDGNHLVDVYLRNGPEFVAVISSDINNHVPGVGIGLEIVVEGLCFYPTNT